MLNKIRSIALAILLCPGNFKLVLQNVSEINLVKGCFQRELWVIKYDIFQLDNGLHNFLCPIFFAGFNHPVWEAM